MKEMRMRRYIIYIIGIVLTLVGCLIISFIIYFYPLISSTIESGRVIQMRQTELPVAGTSFRQVQEDITGLLTTSTILQIRADEILIWYDFPHCIHGRFESLYGSPQSFEEIIAIYSEALMDKKGWRHERYNRDIKDWDLDIEPTHQFIAPDYSVYVNITWWSQTTAGSDIEGEFNTYYLLSIIYTNIPCNT